MLPHFLIQLHYGGAETLFRTCIWQKATQGQVKKQDTKKSYGALW